MRQIVWWLRENRWLDRHPDLRRRVLKPFRAYLAWRATRVKPNRVVITFSTKD